MDYEDLCAESKKKRFRLKYEIDTLIRKHVFADALAAIGMSLSELVLAGNDPLKVVEHIENILREMREILTKEND